MKIFSSAQLEHVALVFRCINKLVLQHTQ